MSTSAVSHPWKFFRTGGPDQVSLNTGADLLALDQFDQKLWVALSCPVKGLELDEKTLALIDADGDGRIRVPELLAAIMWAAARLNDPSDPYEDKEAAKQKRRATVLLVLVVIATAAIIIRWKRVTTGCYFWEPVPVAPPAAEPAK